MDVCGMFSTDAAYNSVRTCYFRDYEQFPYGTLENYKSPIQKDPYSKVQEKCQQAKLQKQPKQPCPFCKEQKKRPLINYLRKREMRKHNDSICEEEAENEEEEHQHQHEHDHCH